VAWERTPSPRELSDAPEQMIAAEYVRMGVKAIAAYLNARKLYTRAGGRWGVGTVHRILTRRTYIGEHQWGRTYKDGTPKAQAETVTVPVPPLIDLETFDAVQELLKARSPMVVPGRTVSGPTLLTGICFCADCGGAMTLRTSGKAKHYRCYTCSTAARQGKTGCKGRTVQMDRLDHLVAEHLEKRLLEPERLRDLLAIHLDRREEREERDERRRAHAAEFVNRAAAAEARLKRLYAAIESGVADLDDPSLRTRIEELKRRAIRPASTQNAHAPRSRARARRSRPTRSPASRPSPADACVERTADFGGIISGLWPSGSRSPSARFGSLARETSS